MLYQPKNDDVLFTFFGISKRIRRRSLSIEVRRRLAVKRKAQRVLEGYSIEVLIRDGGDERLADYNPRRHRQFNPGQHLLRTRPHNEGSNVRPSHNVACNTNGKPRNVINQTSQGLP
jgi:hypothetical protein